MLINVSPFKKVSLGSSIIFMRTSGFWDLKIRNHWLSDIQRHKENSRIETGFLFKLVSFLSFDIATHILWKFSIMQWTILSELIQRETFVTRLQNVRAWSQCTFQNLLYDKMKRRLEEQNEGHQCQSFPQQNSFAFILKRNKINPSRKGFSLQILGVFWKHFNKSFYHPNQLQVFLFGNLEEKH